MSSRIQGGSVSRPGLAASRSIDIIEFLSLFPERGFTLSEIVRATQINIASCYAVLNRLTERGYLTRSPEEKTYTLGPSLIAVGQAGFRSQPLIALAKTAAEELLRELAVPVLLSTVVGDEILAVLALEDAEGRSPGMWVGERLPLVPPVGAPFLAWASEEAVAAWLARRTAAPSEALAKEWRRDLELTRMRGFQIILRASAWPSTASLISQMASAAHTGDYKHEVRRLINSFEVQKAQPATIVDDELYDVLLLASPIFDHRGEASFNLALGGFPQKLTGATIAGYADRLMRTCLEIMRADRAQPRRREREPAPAEAASSGAGAKRGRRAAAR
jgi:DNA-binding IclR family transcriptional regulator